MHPLAAKPQKETLHSKNVNIGIMGDWRVKCWLTQSNFDAQRNQHATKHFIYYLLCFG